MLKLLKASSAGLPGKSKKATVTKQTTLFGLAPGAVSSKPSKSGKKAATTENTENMESQETQETEADITMEDEPLDTAGDALVSNVLRRNTDSQIDNRTETQVDVSCSSPV